MRRLPPLNALRIFEVAARTGSYAEAGAELGLTHGAVSRQISALEGWLGQRLFTREGRRMVATPMAKIFAAEVGLSFDRLAVAAEACGRPGARRILRVSAPTSFAMRWLIPRLNRYHAAHPDVEIAVTTVSCVLDDLRGGVDVAIRRGTAREDAWPQHRVVPVLEDIDTLIMSPALFAERPILKPADIEGHTLFAAETRGGDWTDWLEAAGLHHLAGLPSPDLRSLPCGAPSGRRWARYRHRSAADAGNRCRQWQTDDPAARYPGSADRLCRSYPPACRCRKSGSRLCRLACCRGAWSGWRKQGCVSSASRIGRPGTNTGACT
ncbi:DNA-binding transcriptional LysR family regulator [Bradyrhizobium sp. USDA 4515]